MVRMYKIKSESVHPFVPSSVMLLATLAQSVGVGDSVSSTVRSSFYLFYCILFYLFIFQIIERKMIYFNLYELCYINAQADLNIRFSHMTITGTPTQWLFFIHYEKISD